MKRDPIREIETIFLDFDGVILESVDVKGWAFGKLFENYLEQVDEIVAFHYANGGMSRFDKFRYIYKEILKEALNEEKFEELCRNFSELVYNKVLNCDFVPGALEFLNKYYKALHLFVISGTPHEEMIRIVNARELSIYFQGVFGSPDSKTYWTKLLMDKWKFDTDKVIFLGDALSDHRAAEDNNIKFVARISDGNEIFKDKPVYWKVRDLFEFDNLLSEGNLR